jgi:F1F0 ATPase subunit 2
MDEFLLLALALGGGVLLGTIFFGGLWWTVNRGLSSSQPALWFLVSLLLRTSVTLAGFYLIGGAAWQRWLACILGFTLARLAVRWLTRSPGHRQAARSEGASYAP